MSDRKLTRALLDEAERQLLKQTTGPPDFVLDLNAIEWFVIRTKCKRCGFQSAQVMQGQLERGGATLPCGCCARRHTVVTHLLEPAEAMTLREASAALAQATDGEGESNWLPNLWIVRSRIA